MATGRHRSIGSTSTASSRSILNTDLGIYESNCEWNSIHYQYDIAKKQLRRIKERKELAFEVFQLSLSNYRENPNKENEKFLHKEKRNYELQCSCYNDTQFQLIFLKQMIRFGSI